MNEKNTLDYIKKCEYKKREPGKTWHEQYCFFYKCACKDALSQCERMRKYFKYARNEKEPRAAAYKRSCTSATEQTSTLARGSEPMHQDKNEDKKQAKGSSL